jgi:hypothetical protein
MISRLGMSRTVVSGTLTPIRLGVNLLIDFYRRHGEYMFTGNVLLRILMISGLRIVHSRPLNEVKVNL